MNQLSNVAQKIFPSRLISIDYEDGLLTLQGREWQFLSKGGWRLIDNEKLLSGYEDKNFSELFPLLKNQNIVSIGPQSSLCPIDPVFTFANLWKIEIFTKNSEERWLMKIMNSQPIHEIVGQLD